MIIGLHSPYPRCGKDTTADALELVQGFYRDSFGRGIYEEVSKAFGVTIEQLQSHEWKTEKQYDLALDNCKDESFLEAILGYYDQEVIDEEVTLPRTSRFILQQWGTEYRRAKNPLYWVESLKERVDDVILNSEKDIVITDVREVHEAEYLQELAATTGQTLAIIEITRAAAAVYKTDHSSDAGLPRKYITHTVENVEGRADLMINEVTRIYHQTIAE